MIQSFLPAIKFVPLDRLLFIVLVSFVGRQIFDPDPGWNWRPSRLDLRWRIAGAESSWRSLSIAWRYFLSSHIFVQCSASAPETSSSFLPSADISSTYFAVDDRTQTTPPRSGVDPRCGVKDAVMDVDADGRPRRRRESKAMTLE